MGSRYGFSIGILIIIFAHSSANHDFYRPSENLHCTGSYPIWENANWKENTKYLQSASETWKRIDNYLDSTCSKTAARQAQFTFSGNIDMPTCCEVVNICNRTNCLVLGPNSVIYSMQRERNCVYQDLIQNHFTYEDILIFEDSINPINEYYSDRDADKYLRLEDLNPANDMFPSITNETILQDVRNLKWNTGFMIQQCLSNCIHGDRHLVIQGVGRLPSGCEEVNICNSTVCTVYSKTGMFRSLSQNRTSTLYPKLLYASSACTTTSVTRHRRAAVANVKNQRFPIIPTAHSGGSLHGLLKFNLPGYRYCGPGTDLEKSDDVGGPVNLLDLACRDHDIDYLLGSQTDKADARFLQKVWDLKSELLPLFIAIFEAKRYFEKMVGREYTSSLYYLPPGSNPSLTLYFVEKSAYDEIQSEGRDFHSGKELEERWKTIVRNIWQGTCYSTLLSNHDEFKPFDSDVDTNAGKAVGTDTQSILQPNIERVTGISQSPVSPSTSADEQGANTDALPEDDHELTAGTSFSPCHIVISEIVTRNNENDKSFVELQKLCPRGVKNSRVHLGSFVLIRLVAGDTGLITLNVNLQNCKLKEVRETSGKRMISNFYFVIGTSSVPEADFTIQSGQVVVSDDYLGINRAGETANAFVLLYVPNKVKERVTSQLRLHILAGQTVPSILNEYKESIIKEHLQDILVIGPPCSQDDCRFFSELLLVKRQVVSNDGRFFPIPEFEQNERGNIPFRSLNRCTQSINPMQINDWQEGSPTPGKMNECSNLNQHSLPFSFNGKLLQSTAQQVIMNVYNFFQKATVDVELLEGSATQVTLRATTLSYNTLSNILENYKSNTIKTPGKRVNVHYPVQCQFDEMHYDLLRRIIQNFYSRYTPPLLRDVRSEFLKQVQQGVLARRALGEDVPDFKCGLKTFRIVLKKIGFVFGKVGFRDAILQRPDIIKRRGEYLVAMRANDKLPDPLPVIYTDETWIDPHARSGKGWVPKTVLKPKDRLLYTYKKHKVSRGPRLIVLNAGGSDGYVPGAMKVYPVKKSDSKGDYHDNVDSTTYSKWFSNLLDSLASKGPHLIVIDNAPYHSVTLAPKLKEKKAVLYKWLQENVEPAILETLKPEKAYRKWEIWDLIVALKSRKNFYKIDLDAEQKGHKILRLPPYNCDLNPIEYCWKDLKHEIRKSNVDQNIVTVQKKAEEFMTGYGPEKWRAHIGHVKKLQQTYWDEDGLYEDMLEKQNDLIIPLGDDDESEDEAEDYEPVIRSAVHDLDSNTDGELLV